MDPTSIAFLFRVPQLAKAVGGMLGIVESVDKKLDKLLSSDFDAGIRHLEELKTAKKEQEFLLKQAWSRFNVALTHEKGERKALAYLALSFCQYRLGEEEVALRTLEELTAYEYTDKGARTMQHAAVLAPLLLFGGLGAVALLLGTFTPKSTRQAFFKKMSSIPSEERVNVLKAQAEQFLADERR